MTVQCSSMSRINQNLRETLSIDKITLSVNELVKRYNSFLRETVTNFGITANLRTRLKILDYKAYKKFRRLLLQKFSSKPKVWSYLRKNYYTKDSWVKDIFNGKETQLKVTDISPCKNVKLKTRIPVKRIFTTQYIRKTHEDKINTVVNWL